MPNNELNLKKIFFDSHDIYRHYFGYIVVKILDLVFAFMKKNISTYIFLKKIKNLRLPKKIIKRVKYKSQNIFD